MITPFLKHKCGSRKPALAPCISIEAAQLANKTNAIMRRLSFLATVFVPFTLVGGLMGTRGLPPLDLG